MARRIRRSSMERLQILDLDNLATVSSLRSSLPPPLPPPRKLRCSPLVNPVVIHSQALYDHYRCQTDPIYAATPMFTTVPQLKPEKHLRHILGSYIPPEIMHPISSAPPTPLSPPLKTPETGKKIEENENVNDEKQDDDDDDDDDRSTTNDNDGDDDDDDDKDRSSSSSSSDDDDDDNNDILNDGDDKKGIVEQIFNRDKVKWIDVFLFTFLHIQLFKQCNKFPSTDEVNRISS